MKNKLRHMRIFPKRQQNESDTGERYLHRKNEKSLSLIHIH